MPTRVVPDFFAGAQEMRAVFDARVGPARTAGHERFVWDHWHVPGQYTYFRTHPQRFFPADLYRRFSTELQRWGELHLGCGRTTEAWLSYYVDGCRQELHADVPQGPWAFVFSLTRWDTRRFAGGETLLLRPTVLDYWSHFDPARPLERDALVESVPAHFNQLTVFDPRVPHGVALVEGTRDPLESRVVLHGWFLPPSPKVRGALRIAAAEPTLQAACAAWQRDRGRLGPLVGVITLRLTVDAHGLVEGVVVVAENLVSKAHNPEAPRQAIVAAVDQVRAARFPASSGTTEIILPLSAADP